MDLNLTLTPAPRTFTAWPFPNGSGCALYVDGQFVGHADKGQGCVRAYTLTRGPHARSMHLTGQLLVGEPGLALDFLLRAMADAEGQLFGRVAHADLAAAAAAEQSMHGFGVPATLGLAMWHRFVGPVFAGARVVSDVLEVMGGTGPARRLSRIFCCNVRRLES